MRIYIIYNQYKVYVHFFNDINTLLSLFPWVKKIVSIPNENTNIDQEKNNVLRMSLKVLHFLRLNPDNTISLVL